MSDFLAIEDLELWTRIGIPEEERNREQRVLVSLRLAFEGRTSKKDDLQGSADYGKVISEVRALAAKEHKTMEFFAEEIAGAVLREFHPTSVRVTVKKFALRGIACASFTIERP